MYSQTHKNLDQPGVKREEPGKQSINQDVEGYEAGLENE
jgi:hypothetical protein